MSASPSPLKSPVPTMCQLGPGFAPTSGSLFGVAPFISQLAGWPLVFCHRMSDVPTPLKSLVGPPAEVGRPTKSFGLRPLELAPAAVSSLVPAELPSVTHRL